MKKITAIKVLENYRVSLRFNDGVAGETDFSSKPRTGGVAFWNSYENFRKARIGDAGELLWNDQIDFCPYSLWLQVTGEKRNGIESFCSFAKSRLAKQRGIRAGKFYQHLKESEWRWNHRRDNRYQLLVKEIRSCPLNWEICPQKHSSAVLLREANLYKEIRSKVLALSQFPDTLTDAHGTFQKPDCWRI